MEFVPFLVLTLLLKKALDWFRLIIPGDGPREARLLIPIAWALGVALALLFSASDDLAAGITIWSDHTLATADTALVIVYGLALGSSAGVVHDLVKPHTPPHDGA